MKKGFKGLDAVIGLLIICVFIAALLFALATAAGTYKQIGGAMQEQYGLRTAMGYLAAKVRQNDVSGAVSLAPLGGEQALVLREEVDGEVYETYLYCYEGQLRELFCPAGSDLSPSDGLAVVEADSLRFSMDGGLIRMVCESGGRVCAEYVYVNAWKGETP